jgi:hypothetical protein
LSFADSNIVTAIWSHNFWRGYCPFLTWIFNQKVCRRNFSYNLLLTVHACLLPYEDSLIVVADWSDRCGRSYWPFWLRTFHRNVCTRNTSYMLNGNPSKLCMIGYYHMEIQISLSYILCLKELLPFLKIFLHLKWDSRVFFLLDEECEWVGRHFFVCQNNLLIENISLFE